MIYKLYAGYWKSVLKFSGPFLFFSLCLKYFNLPNNLLKVCVYLVNFIVERELLL